MIKKSTKVLIFVFLFLNTSLVLETKLKTFPQMPENIFLNVSQIIQGNSFLNTAFTNLYNEIKEREEPCNRFSYIKPIYHAFSCNYLFSASLSTGCTVLAEKAIQYGASLFLKQNDPESGIEDFSSQTQVSRK